MPRAPTDLRSLARSHTKLAVQTLAGIARNGEGESARVAASVALLDRGWGRAATVLAGDQDGGPVVINIVHRLRQPETQSYGESLPQGSANKGSVPTNGRDRALPAIEHRAREDEVGT